MRFSSKIIVVFIILVVVIIIKIFQNTFMDKLLLIASDKCKNSNECILSMSEVTDFTWDRVYIFNEGITHTEINRILGFEYKGLTDLKRLIIFVENGSIVYQEEETYDPENPGKIFFQFPDPHVHYMDFNYNKAIFRVTKEKIDNRIFFRLTPLKYYNLSL